MLLYYLANGHKGFPKNVLSLQLAEYFNWTILKNFVDGVGSGLSQCERGVKIKGKKPVPKHSLNQLEMEP